MAAAGSVFSWRANFILPVEQQDRWNETTLNHDTVRIALNILIHWMNDAHESDVGLQGAAVERNTTNARIVLEVRRTNTMEIVEEVAANESVAVVDDHEALLRQCRWKGEPLVS